MSKTLDYDELSLLLKIEPSSNLSNDSYLIEEKSKNYS